MTGPGRRLGAVLTLVVGILAMHGLVSGDHSAHLGAGASASTSSLTAVTASTTHRAGHSGERPVLAVRTPPVLDKAARPGASGPDVVAAVVGLCVAVLLGVVVLRRAGGGGWTTAPSPTATTPAVRTSPPGRGPPRLLLAQLCVLRT